MQRVRVALTGLAAVLVLIAVASAVFRYVSTEPPVTAIGAAKPEVVANIAVTAPGNTSSEPLAELGIAPGTTAPTETNEVAPQ